MERRVTYLVENGKLRFDEENNLETAEMNCQNAGIKYYLSGISGIKGTRQGALVTETL